MELKFNLAHTLSRSNYITRNLNTLLSVLQPSFYCLNFVVKVLLHGPDGSGKRLLAKLAAEKLNMKFCEERVADLFDENIVGTEKKIRSVLQKHSGSAPCVIYLTGYELFCYLEEVDLDRIEQCIDQTLTELSPTDSSQPIVFIGATDDFLRVFRTPLTNLFQHDIQFKPAKSGEALEMIQVLKEELELNFEEQEILEAYSREEFYIGNVMNLIGQLEVESYERRNKEFDIKSEESRNQFGDETRWLDIGGLSEVKKEIIDAIQLSMDYPQLKRSGLRRTGVLLHGPPGTGKTLLAKAVATECELNFINVKGPELLNEYVGQSEDNVRKLFQRARDASPSVIFFDEIDSLAPNRGQAGDSGGVMDRMVSQILSEMDGVGKGEDVFIIGATNRVDLVDPSLLRPGRFDKILEVPLPAGKDIRLEILRALTRKMQLSDDVDLVKIESLAKSDMSGAEFQSLCSRASHRTLDRCIRAVESGEDEGEVNIVTTMDDFLQSLNS